jgi:hypothetical protein
MYGVTLVMGVATYAICLTVDVYTACSLLIAQYKGYQPTATPRVAAAALRTAATCARVFCSAFASHRANSAYRQAVSRIRKLTLPAGLKPEIQDQLESFSIQLSDNKIEFTACGVFSVNFKLVRSLVYTVTTNVIVLVQATWFNQ